MVMSQTSELFEVDIEQFMGNLQAMLAYVNSILNEMQTKRHIPEDILQNLNVLSNKACVLRTILSLMKRRAQRFRPNNMDLYQALIDLEKDIKNIESTLWMALQAYQRDPNFGIKGVSNAISDVGAYVNTIRLKMNTFIQDGLFA